MRGMTIIALLVMGGALLYPGRSLASVEVTLPGVAPSGGFQFAARPSRVDETPNDFFFQFVRRTLGGQTAYIGYRVDVFYTDTMDDTKCRNNDNWQPFVNIVDSNPTSWGNEVKFERVPNGHTLVEKPAHFRLVATIPNPGFLRIPLSFLAPLSDSARTYLSAPGILACTSGSPVNPAELSTSDGRVRISFHAEDADTGQKVIGTSVFLQKDGSITLGSTPVVMIHSPNQLPHGLTAGQGYRVIFQKTGYKSATSEEMVFNRGSVVTAKMASSTSNKTSSVAVNTETRSELGGTQTGSSLSTAEDCTANYLKILNIQILKFATCQVKNGLLIFTNQINSLLKGLKI